MLEWLDNDDDASEDHADDDDQDDDDQAPGPDVPAGAGDVDGAPYSPVSYPIYLAVIMGLQLVIVIGISVVGYLYCN